MYENDWDFTPTPENEGPDTPPPAQESETQEPEAERALYPALQAGADFPPAAERNEPIIIRATPRARTRTKRAWPRVAALVLCCALLGGAAGAGGALLTQRLTALTNALRGGSTVIYQGSGTPVVVNLAKIEAGQALTPAEVYAANENSVVGITTQVTTNVWGRTVASAASGSGFVLTSDGYIVTNYHVIEDATSITIQFKNGDKLPAQVVGGEEDKDVAVLKLDAENLTPVRLGASSDLVVGEDVVAIGNPLGEMTFSMTRGIVSALDKRLTMSDGTVINVLQTDAAINSGNSGGPLFNMYGQVIGITNAKYSNNGSSQASIEGICFAIPIDDVSAILTDLIEHGYVTGKPYMGATLATVSSAEATRHGRTGGAYVQELVSGGAAEKAGLQVGDIITAMDGETVDSWPTFMTLRDRHRAGDTVSLTVDRAGKLITISLTFDEQPASYQTPQSSSANRYDHNYNYDPFNWYW